MAKCKIRALPVKEARAFTLTQRLLEATLQSRPFAKVAIPLSFTAELDTMVNIVPFNTAGNGLLGFGLLGNGGSDGCDDFV